MKVFSIICTVTISVLTITEALGQKAVSGYDYQTPEIQQMQNDDFGNPGMLAVESGAVLFEQIGSNGKSCATCHGADGSKLDASEIARYPKYNGTMKRPTTLRGQIISCRNQRQQGPEIKILDEQSVQLEAYVRRLALDEAVNVDTSGPLAPHYERGKELFHSRWGQVDIACHQCHDYHAGRTFRGQVLTQGQTNGFPAYRYTAGKTVSTPERITGCLTNLRAEPYAADSPEYVDLEVYMNARGNGLKIETPGIRY
jgi:sulfur-oxidizing protein SoxA